ncbi:MAG: polyribonucleotide nucleotidyltransferase, partial [Patescibacteria group bacterium]
MQEKTFECSFGGRTLTAAFTDLADQAHGSVMVRYGETTILVTAVIGEKERLDVDYFPLTVDYEERFYSAGRILGSRFIRSEGRPSDEAVLSGRVVDRTIRPLFNAKLRRDVQVVVTVLSIGADDPDVLGIIGASLALGTSEIPWSGPVSAVRIGKKKGAEELIVNPTYAERNAGDAELDLLVCGKNGMITMIEVGANEASEELLARAFARASEEIEKVQGFQQDVIRDTGVAKMSFASPAMNPEIPVLFESLRSEFQKAVFCGKPGWDDLSAFKSAWLALVAEKLPDEKKAAEDFLEVEVETLMDQRAINEGVRIDGRKTNELRPLYAKAGGVSPVLHGSGIFYRGGTHIFSALTLGGPEDTQIIDSIEEREEKKRFMHHYNFPPFSVGETGRMGGMNRRMIGHGALAEKALTAVIPPKETFPYTIRLVSEALASNGSTSMGSVCASTLALMDGGVPITAPVAGIAM